MRCVSAPLTARAQLETACEVLPLPGFPPFLEKTETDKHEQIASSSTSK